MQCNVCYVILVFFVSRTLSFSVQYLNKREGEPCSLGDGRNSTCKYASNCEGISKALRAGFRPPLCNVWDGHPTVCCPFQSEVDRRCLKYYLDSWSSLSGIGGSKAAEREFPHMAALGYGNADNKQWLCGGSLISTLYVLTAAHCLFSRDLGPVKYVRLGYLNLKNQTDVSIELEVAEAIKHPGYSPKSRYNDIALIKLSRFVEINEYVRPACVHDERNVHTKNATATGWGRLGPDEEASDHLIKIPMEIFKEEECIRTFRNTDRLPNGFDAKSMICAGGREAVRDTCEGDSGGPLQIRHHLYGIFYHQAVIGVTAFGKRCGQLGVPGAYTRVANYVDWIEKIVWPPNFEEPTTPCVVDPELKKLLEELEKDKNVGDEAF